MDTCPLRGCVPWFETEAATAETDAIFATGRAAGGAGNNPTALELIYAQAAAEVQTNQGGLQAGNVTANHSAVSDTIAAPVKSRAVARREKEERLQKGRKLAMEAGIDLSSISPPQPAPKPTTQAEPKA